MEEIEQLLEKYYNGDTTLAEEQRLRAFFNQDNLHRHLQTHAPQFRLMHEFRQEQAPEVVPEWLLETPQPAPTVRRLHWGWQVAASVALLIIGFAGGIGYNHWRANQNSSVPAVAHSEVMEVKRVLQFDPQQQTSASERIRAVNQSTEFGRADREITQILINTMNFDENVNVRLAACQALYRFRNEPGVREALIQSLKVQNDPNMQIALIEILVEIKEKRAVEEMRRLMENSKVLNVVRLKAEQGISNLI